MVKLLGRSPERTNAIWGTADQIASGLSNILLPLTVARVGSPSQLGALSATVVALTSLVAVSRVSLGSQVLLAADKSTMEPLVEASRGTALAIVLSPITVPLVMLVGLVSGGGEALAAVAIVSLIAPVLLVQDLLRFLCSARRNSKWAFLSDLLWLVAMGLGWLLLGSQSYMETPLPVTAAAGIWGIGALLALGVVAARVRWRPRFRGLKGWLFANADHLLHSSGGTASIAAANTLRVSGIGTLVGPLAVGALAAGQLLMTPLNLLVALVPFIAMPLIVRMGGASDPAIARRAYGGLAVALTVASLLWWLVCESVPDWLGEVLLGPAWLWADRLIAPMAVMSAGILVTATASALLLTMGRSRRYAATSICIALTSLGAAIAVAIESGEVSNLAWVQTAVVWGGAMLAWSLARFK